SQKVKSGHDKRTGCINVFERSHQQNGGVPEKTPEAECNHALYPAGQCRAELLHRPDPQRCNYWTDTKEVVEIHHLEGAQHIPCCTQTRIRRVDHQALGGYQYRYFLICLAIVFLG